MVRATRVRVTLVRTIQAKEDPVKGILAREIQDKQIRGKEIQDRPGQVKIDPIKVASRVLTKTTVNGKRTKESPAYPSDSFYLWNGNDLPKTRLGRGVGAEVGSRCRFD